MSLLTQISTNSVLGEEKPQVARLGNGLDVIGLRQNGFELGWQVLELRHGEMRLYPSPSNQQAMRCTKKGGAACTPPWHH